MYIYIYLFLVVYPQMISSVVYSKVVELFIIPHLGVQP